VARHELRVEQREAAIFQARDEIDEGDLAGVARLGEHALAKERAAEMHAVKAAGQSAVLPDLDRMAVPQREQFAVEAPDAAVDPGRAPA
jgi:hypothetical protein